MNPVPPFPTLRWRTIWRLALLFALLIALLYGSAIPPGDEMARLRVYTRPLEFDFLSWTLDALAVKGGQGSLAAADYLSPDARRQLVLDYLEVTRQAQDVENSLRNLYADPSVTDPDRASAALRVDLDGLLSRRQALKPLAEASLQAQLQEVLADLGLTMGGQPVPPVLYHTASPPKSLIVSPRDVIQQDANLSIDPELTIDEITALEAEVDQGLDVSSLVVPVGGIGLYPTMVMETSDLNWLADTVAHEWIHNYLTLRPLGINYFSSPELRTINETVASIAGQEIGRALVARFYPERLPPPPDPPAPRTPSPPSEPPVFDFRAEMRATRVTVDALLAAGEIEEAEAYMEERRLFFWEHGYRLRKLNQAYFAFYGAYADQPGGAAGGDPVGPAVRALRQKSASLADFVRQAAWITSFAELQRLVAGPVPQGN